ncbi:MULTISPECIES: hypothetical protein [Pandoraea]|uniref:Uncharacterized protein n=2 Tax=Pandoraea TaxID=93217 RepID=A0A5E4XFP4_9BURK|nr:MULTISPECIES: hypothetical protein [Pandoraea]VVE17340.1 hypothetical protein PCE31107_02964 [Pandoraea cepalis]VVE35123.1 hypothetical protein PTE31013_03884 [Pandoraea terrigena]
MNSNNGSTAQWMDCRVVFSATKDGRRADNIEITGSMACFDRKKDLSEQAGAAVADWLSRKERIHGHSYHDAEITYLEVQTPDGRYLNATRHGWGVLDDSLRRRAIEQSGYSIRNGGLMHSWYALLPGETEINQDEDNHNYIGFFSSEEELIEEVYERVVGETAAV